MSATAEQYPENRALTRIIFLSAGGFLVCVSAAIVSQLVPESWPTSWPVSVLIMSSIILALVNASMLATQRGLDAQGVRIKRLEERLAELEQQGYASQGNVPNQ
jgi:hypothetical protein